ncbi:MULTISPECIES: hypothetical protein [unclassified Carboxylicivirga]|uniref:hypothetical protein n=1 Tax=Carboxylicivirga TaxID=1628153 RepID=UPI003D355DE3
MKKIVFLMLLVVLVSSCKKDNFHYDRLAEAKFDGNIMDYLRSDDYNWSMTVEMIERAATNPGDEYLIDLFEGTSDLADSITFFGFTNHSIRRWMYDPNPWIMIPNDGAPGRFPKDVYQEVSQIPVELCAYFVKSHILLGARNKGSFNKGYIDYTIGDIVGKTQLDMLYGNSIFAWKEDPNTTDAPGLYPVTLKVRNVLRYTEVVIASADIHPSNGYVHSLSYKYTIGQINY